MTDGRRVLDVTDPVALRALAHPVRLRLLHLVGDAQPVTGTRLADLAGESTATVSYHLSVLARHGFVEPDTAPGPTRRHKPWRTTFESLRITRSDEPGLPPMKTPEGAVLATMLAEMRSRQDAYLSGTAGLVDEWQDAGAFSMTHLMLTAAQLEEMTAEVLAVIERYRGLADPEGNGATQRSRCAVSFVAVPT
jgi:DNA-binding transcriptional ArsR family regulator